MQERVFMGIGNKPFMDIQPSEAAISDRAVDCGLMGRGTLILAVIAIVEYKQHVWLTDLRFRPPFSEDTMASSHIPKKCP